MSRGLERGTLQKRRAFPRWRWSHAPILLFALAALAWVGTASSNIVDPAIAVMADRVARGETYDPSLLRQFVTADLKSQPRLCDSRNLRQLLILQLSAADRSSRSIDLRAADADLAGVARLARQLLSCAPADSIGWLAVYWAEIHRNGFGPEASAFLEQSYRFAPHEAWIQLIRAPLALRSFDALSRPLQSAAAQDFQDIFRAQLFPSAVALYRAAPVAARLQLLDGGCGFSWEERKTFLHFATDAGLKVKHPCFEASPTDEIGIP